MLTAENIIIDDTDVRLARETPHSQGATLVLKTADGAETTLPGRIQGMLLAVLASVAENGEATLGRLPEERTSTVASEWLEVSRPTLMKWVHQRRICGFTVAKRPDRVQLDNALYRADCPRFAGRVRQALTRLA
ncbi:DNA-binding protein [Brachybacterium sp. EF45031]|uniref:DNA-binding protein n=1 Tax=Brachybacterium sillae TaxID=2810536 RepID=UPI00217D0E7E|nr:DNA-binding protein [Brachybacterium sillae]MCS6711824.1 DNA-binding protein [Brachybacterium sillae]